MSAFSTYLIRVQYEDTDFSGFVYHANFIKYCERARSDFTRQKGVDQMAYYNGPDKIAFVVARIECDFIRPARFGDDLIVETEFKDVQGARMIGVQVIKRGEEKIFAATVTVVLIGGNGRPRRLPPEMLKAFMS